MKFCLYFTVCILFCTLYTPTLHYRFDFSGNLISIRSVLAAESNPEKTYIPKIIKRHQSVVSHVGKISALNNGRWIRCFRAHDETIYFRGGLKSMDGGKTVVPQQKVDVEQINIKPERAVLATPQVFYAAGGGAQYVRSGTYKIRAWRSTDNLKTIKEEESYVYVPDGPRARKDGEWFGLYVYRTILEMPDGSWLMTMYGNFADDEIPPEGIDARKETKYMMRSFVVTSTDKGRTWHYLSSVAIPKKSNRNDKGFKSSLADFIEPEARDPIGEGFVEPAITMLDDGRLLCVMRTGHHFPLYASWSSDNGRTWTEPVYTGLDRACDPCLIRLRDGRVALSWGRRYPEGWSRISELSDKKRFSYPGEGYVNLAISNDGGETWVNHKIAGKTGSCYSTIFEVEPNVVFFQVDQWYWNVQLKGKK